MKSSETNKDWFENVGYEIEVIKTAPCRAYHKVGQKYTINDFTTPEGLCIESFHAMYPLLFAGRIDGDFTQLGSKDKDRRIFNCPARVVQFQIQKFFQCNNCGKKVKKEELKQSKKEYENFSLDVLVCDNCFTKLEVKKQT